VTTNLPFLRVLVRHPAFRAEATRLSDYRTTSGIKSSAFDITDIYDEFSDGGFDPGAIRSFLRQAYHSWQRPAPTYVLLVGEASFDYRGGYGSGALNYVPSVMIDLPDVAGGAGAVTPASTASHDAPPA